MFHLILICLSFTLNSIQYAHTDCRRVAVYIRQIPRIIIDRESTLIRLRVGTSGVGIAAGARDSVVSKTRSVSPDSHSLLLNGHWWGCLSGRDETRRRTLIYNSYNKTNERDALISQILTAC